MIPGACQPDRTRMSGGHVTDHRLSINPVHGVHGGPRLISITSAYGLDFTCKLRLTPFGIISLCRSVLGLMTPSPMIIEFCSGHVHTYVWQLLSLSLSLSLSYASNIKETFPQKIYPPIRSISLLLKFEMVKIVERKRWTANDNKKWDFRGFLVLKYYAAGNFLY